MINLKEHYDNLAIQFDKCWHFSDEYLEANKIQIIDLLDLKKDDIFIDLGCGSGLYSKLIHNEIQFTNKITCVQFTDKEIENGILELEAKYNTINQFVISDNMISILAKK